MGYPSQEAMDAKEFALRALRQITALEQRVVELEKDKPLVYRSPEWYAIRDKLIASLPKSDFPVRPGYFQPNAPDPLDAARGKAPYNYPGPPFANVSGLSHPGQLCWGCNEDDRGFVVVKGCPKHDSPPVAHVLHSSDGVSGE